MPLDLDQPYASVQSADGKTYFLQGDALYEADGDAIVSLPAPDVPIATPSTLSELVAALEASGGLGGGTKATGAEVNIGSAFPLLQLIAITVHART